MKYTLPRIIRCFRAWALYQTDWASHIIVSSPSAIIITTFQIAWPVELGNLFHIDSHMKAKKAAMAIITESFVARAKNWKIYKFWENNQMRKCFTGFINHKSFNLVPEAGTARQSLVIHAISSPAKVLSPHRNGLGNLSSNTCQYSGIIYYFANITLWRFRYSCYSSMLFHEQRRPSCPITIIWLDFKFQMRNSKNSLSFFFVYLENAKCASAISSLSPRRHM